MIDSFHPPVRTLMGPGPSDVNPRILDALSRSTIGHLDPKFVEMMDEVKSLLQFAFQTSNELTIPISAPGRQGGLGLPNQHPRLRGHAPEEREHLDCLRKRQERGRGLTREKSRLGNQGQGARHRGKSQVDDLPAGT